MLLDLLLICLYILAIFMIGLSLALFLSRVSRPDLARIFRNVVLFLGILAFALLAFAIKNQLMNGFWFHPLMYVIFSLSTLLVDVLLKIGFRQAIRPGLLAPFLLLLIVPLIWLWFVLGKLGLIYWAIVGVVYFLILASSFYALFALIRDLR